MSYTKRQFIQDAFANNGVTVYDMDIDGGEYQIALNKLDNMMSEWDADGIRVSYPLPRSPSESSLDTLTAVPQKANNAIVVNLANRIASIIRKPVTRDMKVEAKDAKRALIKSLVNIKEQQYLDTTPKGAGYKTWRGNGSGLENPFFRETDCNDEL